MDPISKLQQILISKKVKEKLLERVLRNEYISRKRVSRLCGKPSILDERVYNWFAAVDVIIFLFLVC